MASQDTPVRTKHNSVKMSGWHVFTVDTHVTVDSPNLDCIVFTHESSAGTRNAPGPSRTRTAPISIAISTPAPENSCTMSVTNEGCLLGYWSAEIPVKVALKLRGEREEIPLGIRTPDDLETNGETFRRDRTRLTS